MSYFDTMSETDEMRAWEEGRLEGLKDIQRVTRHWKFYRVRPIIDKIVEVQQDLLVEIYGKGEKE